jgi:hypothetical protein
MEFDHLKNSIDINYKKKLNFDTNFYHFLYIVHNNDYQEQSLLLDQKKY